MSTATAPGPAPASPPSAPPRTFKEVWLISAGHGLTHWYPATFYVLLPVIGKELGLSFSQIGIIMSVQFLAGAIANIPGGIIVDLYGKKGYLMALSLLWVGLPYAFMSFTHSYWMLLVCVALVGIGNNLWHPAAIPTLAQRYPERKGLVLSFHGMGGNIGEAIGPLVIGWLLLTYSWRTVVWLNVVPGVAMAGAILVGLGAFAVGANAAAAASKAAEKPKAEGGGYLGGFKQLLKNRAVMMISLSGTFRSMTQHGLLIFLPVYLAFELNYSTVAVGLSLTLLQVAGFIAGPIGGHLSDRMGRKRVVMSSMAMTAVVIVIMVLAGRSQLFVFSIALLGFFLYATRPVMHAWALDSAPSNLAGSTVGIQFAMSAVGASIAPAVFGIIADTYSVFAGFYFLAGTIIVANVLIFFMPNGAPPKAATAGSH
jgi:MFS family permease